MAAVALNDGFFHRQLVETFLNQETNDSVGVEHKITTFGQLVSDDGVQTSKLIGLGQKNDVFADLVGNRYDGGDSDEFGAMS